MSRNHEACLSGVEASADRHKRRTRFSVLPARMKGQRDAVHAVSHSGRRRTVGKQVPQMPAAPRAMNLGPDHAEAVIGRRPNCMLERRPETRPPGAAFELRVRRKQRLTAAGAAERPVTFFATERARASRFRAVLAQHLKLLGRQRLAPLIFRFCKGLLSHASSLPNQESGKCGAARKGWRRTLAVRDGPAEGGRSGCPRRLRSARGEQLAPLWLFSDGCAVHSTGEHPTVGRSGVHQ